MLGQVIKQLRLERNKSQIELCEELNIEQGTLANYENGRRIPKLDILVRIADYFGVSVDYMLGRDSDNCVCIGEVLGYDGLDEHAVTFQQKLCNQIDFNQTLISDLANSIGVNEKTIVEWLLGTNQSYSNYYQQLSEYFQVQERYWTSPRALSPGIEPNVEEYLLLLLRRDYFQTGKLNDIYGTLENFFPGIKVVTDSDEASIVDSYRQLSPERQIVLKGKAMDLLLDQRREDSADGGSGLKASGK